jgi:hypothetical protein
VICLSSVCGPHLSSAVLGVVSNIVIFTAKSLLFEVEIHAKLITLITKFDCT